LIEDATLAERRRTGALELTGRDRRVYLATGRSSCACRREVDEAARDYAFAAQAYSPYGMDVRQGAQMLADALRN